MLKVIIVDDEENAREAIAGMLALYPGKTELAGAYPSLKLAVEGIKQHQPQVVLLDIEIGRESGFDIFTHFPKPAFKTIFITAYQQYAIEAFRFAALDYLLKPLSPALLHEALEKALERIDMEKLSLKLDF